MKFLMQETRASSFWYQVLGRMSPIMLTNTWLNI